MRGTLRLVSVAWTLLAAVGAAPLASGGESWVEVRSPAFVVVSNGSEKDARWVLVQFEQVRALLQEVWPGARVDTERPVIILAVRNEAGLRALLPEYWENKKTFHPAGIALSGPDRSFVALRLDVARFHEEDESWVNPYLLAFHEYVHIILRMNFPALPLWLNEGLAEFWGNTVIEGDRVYDGRYIPYHLQTLRERTPMPLAALFAVGRGSPEYSEQNRATIYYAESWALVHYLVLGSDQRRGQINRFGALLQAGRPVADAVAEAFGDVPSLDRELQSYVRRPVFRHRTRKARLAVQAEGSSRPLREAESLAVRAAFHVATGHGAEARDLLGRALTMEPGLAAAHEALGLLAWREGQTAEALEALGRATALPGASDFAHYLYGRLLWDRREAATLPQAEAALRRAVELNPNFADAHATLARIMADRVALSERTRPAAATVSAEVSVETACGDGDAAACASVARSLDRGEGAEANPAKAARLYEGGCATGDAEACARLGSLLRQGRGVAKDARRAGILLAKACDAGSAFACAELGLLLEKGEPGVPADPARARAVAKRACELRHEASCAGAGP